MKNERKIIVRDNRREVWRGNTMIAYVDRETSILCVLDGRGYVTKRAGIIDRDSEILPMLDAVQT